MTSLLPALLAMALTAVGAQESQPMTYSRDELVVLNGIGGFGEIGSIRPSRGVLSPHNELGFSLRIEWRDRPGGAPFWSIRQGLPPGTDPMLYDRLQFDLYVVSTDEEANLAIMLLEADDDRWLCRSGPLRELEPRRWHHFEVARDDMKPWLLGNKEREWERLTGLAIEPSRGQAVFHVDGVRLVGTGGRKLEIFNLQDDGLAADPEWHEPLQPVPPPGVVYLPAIAKEGLGDAPLRFQKLLGAVATTGSGAPLVRRMAAAGIPLVHYSGYAQGYTKFLTRRGAWDTNARGQSPNQTPFFLRPFNRYHTFAYAHPAAFEAGRHRIDGLVRAGIGVWMVVDYTFPWADGPFGYSPAMLEAYRRDLAGADEGLEVRENGRVDRWLFADYFAAYHGFTVAPGDLGLRTFEEFSPPRPGEEADRSRALWTTFLMLRSYEWLKHADRVGRYLQSKGGDGLWVVPNPEDSWGSSDYLMLLRSAGVTNLFPEWFGNAGHLAEGAYASGPYLREAADRSRSRLSVLFETGAGGHAQPYWDWRVAFNTAYALTAATQADDFDNDFINTAPYEVMSEPERGAEQFRRFRDTVAKALAFQLARAERAARPAAPILCVTERPPAKATGSLFFGLGRRGRSHSLAAGLSRAHLPFDSRDSLGFEEVLERYRLVAYSPWAPRAGDLERMREWLMAQPGRVLVTHSFVPTRDAREFWGQRPGTALGDVTDDVLGLGRIETTTATQATITKVDEAWRDVVAAGQAVDFPSPLTRRGRGEPLVDTDAGPLVTRSKVGAGEVLYLHYTPGDSEVLQRLDAQVMRAAARAVGIEPRCEAEFEVPVQVFDVPGGVSVVAWDAPTGDAWTFKYQPGIPPLPWEADGVERTVSLPAAGDDPWLCYSFWSDRLAESSPLDGRVALRLEGALTDLFYAGPASATLRDTIERARNTRRRMRELRFEAVEG